MTHFHLKLRYQGTPYPLQDQNAVDAVMQFAIHKLGFLPGNIVLFGWSIGGYSSLVAAAQYPDIKGVVRFKYKAKVISIHEM